ncbi:MAG: alpha/beta fold hydrolase [Alphaproteobacteria bacterium]|nr:alpha/beta fold hydrolase [Alphaproteobacteria bacterium]
MTLPPWPEPHFVETNGIRMAVYEDGPKDGTPIVLCHGFPELAYSWRYQLPALAKAGFRAIAPDMRGYGRTSRPATVEDYDIHHLTGDLAGLLDALEIEKAVFCGHDWGGIVVWQMPLLQKARVAGVIGVNTPFMARAPMDPIEGMRLMFGENMYIVWFQKPGVADAVLAKDVGKTFRFFMRKGGMTLEEFEKQPQERRNLELGVALAGDEAIWPGELVMSEPELQVFIDTFEKTGFTGGINWYRNFTRNWKTTEGVEEKVTAPCLMIMAENDVVLRPSMADGMEKYCPDLEKHLVKNCGHWTQQEHPDELNEVMVSWLVRRFGIR